MSPELSRGWLPLISEFVFASSSHKCFVPVQPRYSPRHTGGFWVAGWSRGRGVCRVGGQQGCCLGGGCPCSSSFPYCRGLAGLSTNSPAVCPISTGKTASSLRRMRCSPGTVACQGSSPRCWIGAKKVADPCNTQGLSRTCSYARHTGHQKALLSL